MISEKHNFIFFHIPKAAGTSVINLLSNHLQDTVVVNENNSALLNFLEDKDVLWANHVSCGTMEEFLGTYVFKSFFKFCFVRNPWSRLVSLYHYTLQKEAQKYVHQEKSIPEFSRNILKAGSFENWIKSNDIGSSQFDMISDNSDELMVDFVGKSENLQNDFSYVCGLIGIENISFDKKANASQHQDYKTYYTNETQEIVKRHYQKDIEYFGYAFNETQSPQTSKINNIFIKKKSTDSIKIYKLKNINKWCEIPENYSNETIVVHPNDIGESKFEIGFYLCKANQTPFSSIQFIVCPYDENTDNKGAIMEITIEDNYNVIQKESYTLNPRVEKIIQLQFNERNYYRLSINIRVAEEASSNAYSGIRLSAIDI